MNKKRAVGIALVAAALVAGTTYVTYRRAGEAPGSRAQQSRNNPAPPSPYRETARERIQAARKAGRIDYGTSLLYRAYALFQDARLPVQYSKDAVVGEDRALFHEIEVNADQIPADVRAQLEPYLVRPTDPKSYFNQPPPQAFWNVIVPPVHAASAANQSCQGRWTHAYAAQGRIKVWACGSGERWMDRTVQLFDVEGLWPRMTAYMGEPVFDSGRAEGDRGGGDPAIDIYLVPFPTLLPGGRPEEDHFAVTLPADHLFKEGTSSGYIVMNTAVIQEDPEFKSTLIHEFFHVQQNALNERIGFHESIEFWFVEASAVWAQWHFAPEIAPEQVHHNFISFQDADHPLHQPTPQEHTYSSYIWFFFMQQQRGSPYMVADIWRGLRGLRRDQWDKALEIIDSHLPFEHNFRLFARRNLNDPYGGLFASPALYSQLDPKFPVGSKPGIWQPETDPAFLYSHEGQTPYPVKPMPGLRAGYFRFYVTDDGIQQLRFDFSQLRNVQLLDVDAIVRLQDNQQWRLISVHSGDTELRLCRMFPDQKVDQVELVLSNHSKSLSDKDKIDGNLLVEATDEPCACGSIEIQDDRRWVDNTTVALDSVNGYSSSLETSTGRFTIDVDEHGRVVSRGGSTMQILKNSLASTNVGVESRNEVTTDVTSVVGEEGVFEIGSVQPDGIYAIDACTGPVQVSASTAIVSSEPGLSRSRARITRDGGICTRVEGKTDPRRPHISGRQEEPARLRVSIPGVDTTQSSYSASPGPGMTATGSVSGSYRVSWNMRPCASRQQ
ncbi:MAG: hypothetical protein WD690_15365 [Vicinamibacterales bacterium]